ncbi:PREDICTED: multidrug resistance-associated protein 4-like, partial [Wasmannia auropunctata]|uniref:multidrug resistance-associated protein 4-like n=1 Tax=Wasmannia auropunctata TaxID=64793 RepID=UPI0005EE295B
MDELLPKTMLDAVGIFFRVCGVMILEVIINQWILIPIVILIVLIFFATKYFVKVVRDIKRLEGVMK